MATTPAAADSSTLQDRARKHLWMHFGEEIEAILRPVLLEAGERMHVHTHAG
jgi:hypothetical protein